MYCIKIIGTYSISCKLKSYSGGRSKRGRLVLVSNYAICDKLKLRFIKNQRTY